MFAAPVGAAHTVRARRDVPNLRQTCASMLSCVSKPFDPPYEYGRMLAPPACAFAARIFSTISSNASSHETRLNWPSPFLPVRTAGYISRSGPYTSSPNLRTFAQMKPSVTGFLREPSILMILPFFTVTARLHASGQSSGHAVSTTTVEPENPSADSDSDSWEDLLGSVIAVR